MFVFHMKAEAKGNITNPFFEVRIAKDVMPVYRRHGHFCMLNGDSKSAAGEKKCVPNADGIFEFKQKLILPKNLKPGKYKVTIKTFGEDKNNIGCVNFPIKFTYVDLKSD